MTNLAFVKPVIPYGKLCCVLGLSRSKLSEIRKRLKTKGLRFGIMFTHEVNTYGVDIVRVRGGRDVVKEFKILVGSGAYIHIKKGGGSYLSRCRLVRTVPYYSVFISGNRLRTLSDSWGVLREYVLKDKMLKVIRDKLLGGAYTVNYSQRILETLNEVIKYFTKDAFTPYYEVMKVTRLPPKYLRNVIDILEYMALTYFPYFTLKSPDVVPTWVVVRGADLTDPTVGVLVRSIYTRYFMLCDDGIMCRMGLRPQDIRFISEALRGYMYEIYITA